MRLGIAHRRRPRAWLIGLPVIALAIWLTTPTLSAIALRPGDRPSREGPRPTSPPAPAVTLPVPTPTVPTPPTVPPTTVAVPVPGPTPGSPPTAGGAAPTTITVPRPAPTAVPGATPPASTPPAPSPAAVLPPTTGAAPTSTTVPGSSVAGLDAASGLNSSTTGDECKPDPAPEIAALPPGGVFVGHGCYVTSGILINKPVTIDGGVYRDHQNTNPGDGRVHPIIRVGVTKDVTIENVQLVGANPDGNYHSQLVGQAGLDVLSSDNVSIRNVSVKNTFGDGLTVFAAFGKSNKPTSNLHVDGLTITNAGRQAITMAYATNSTLNNVTVNSAFGDGWDFESDLPGIGSSNITVSNSRSTKGVRFIEALRGPVTFENCQCQRHVTVTDEAAASGQPVTFEGGSVLLPNNGNAGAAGITVDGPGRLFFSGVMLGRLPSSVPPVGPAWSVSHHGYLSLDDSPAVAPLGHHDPSSTVVISS